MSEPEPQADATAVAPRMVTLPRAVIRPRVRGQGASPLTLLAYDVMYDADRPVPFDELIDRMLPNVSNQLANGLLRWYYTRKQQEQEKYKKDRRTKPVPTALPENSDNLSELREVPIADEEEGGLPAEIYVPMVDKRVLVEAWMKIYWKQRARRMPDTLSETDLGFIPGEKPPQKGTMDGTLLDYTRETRHRLTHQQQADSEKHALLMTVDAALRQLDVRTLSPSQRCLPLAWMARKVAEKGPRTDESFTEQTIRGAFHEVLDHRALAANIPDVLQRILDWASKPAKSEVPSHADSA